MILSRVKISPQQRYDLEDFLAGQAASRGDSQYYVQKFLTDTNMVISGFTVSGIGLTQATVAMTGAALVMPQSTDDFSYFIAASSDPDIVITDADLVDGARNYVEAQLTTLDGVPLVKAFWDPEANSGLGQEFNQVVNTITDLRVSFVVSTGGFSGSPDRLPIAIIDTDGSGAIKIILDRREKFGRLSKPNDIDHSYSWGTKQEPVYQLALSGVVGTFTAGETINIGSEDAIVVAGGTTSITFNCPSGINFSVGDSVTGVSSGASGTILSVFENFLGVDKSLSTQKSINDALMTEIKLMKGTRFWYQTTPSLAGNKQENMSTIAPVSGGARVLWNGSSVVLTNDSLAPSVSDNIASIRILSSTSDLMLRRQDDGKEIVTITLNGIPDDGILTLDQNGNSIAINFDDSTSDIQATWDADADQPATITGSPAAEKIVITYDNPGLQVDVSVDTNTLEKSSVTVTPTVTIKQGMTGDFSIGLNDGQVLYVDLPSPLADTNYSGVGSGATNYKVADRGSLALTDATYWLAYREGSKLIWRFAGELQVGETSQISDNVPQSFLDAIGLASEAALPSYSSDIRGVSEESLVKRIGVLTDAVGDEQENRSGYLRSDDKVLWTGTQLEFTADLVLELVNTKDGVVSQHQVLLANSPLVLADGESAWILIDRSLASQNCAVFKTTVTPLPAQTQAGKDIFVLFRRHDSLGSGYLHIPFHKQVIEPGQQVRLGASGSGSGSSPLFVQEVPVGDVDGFNADFTLSSEPKSVDSLLVTVDSMLIPPSEWGLVGQVITFLAGSIPALGQSVDVFYVGDSVNNVVGVQEVPSGLIDGSNDTFGLSGNPPYKAALMVFVDGQLLKANTWSLVQSFASSSLVISSGSIPTLGQSLDVMYFTLDGTGGGGGGGGDSSTKVEYRVITGPEAAAKQLTLNDTPAVPGDSLLDVKNVGAQWYGDDFTISGNILGWTGLGLDSLPIVAGDKFRIVYFT